MEETKIGLIGCGMISGAYFNAAKTFRMIEVVACADGNSAAAEQRGGRGVEQLIFVDQCP